MTIRPAIPADIMAILAIIEEAHAKSRYAKVGNVDRDYTRRLFARAMHFNGNTNDHGTMFLVAENEGKIEGYFFGFLDRVYQIGDKLAAQEVHFYLSPRADQKDALRVLTAFTDWAKTNPKVVEIRIGESDIMGEPDGRFAALLLHKGFKKAASVFTYEVTN